MCQFFLMFYMLYIYIININLCIKNIEKNINIFSKVKKTLQHKIVKLLSTFNWKLGFKFCEKNLIQSSNNID